MKSNEKSPLHFLTCRQAKGKEKCNHGYTKDDDKINLCYVSPVFSLLLYYITKNVQTPTQHSARCFCFLVTYLVIFTYSYMRTKYTDRDQKNTLKWYPS